LLTTIGIIKLVASYSSQLGHYLCDSICVMRNFIRVNHLLHFQPRFQPLQILY
jgi:hypothetical protein